MIPRILHYCFGMKPDFGGKPWSLVHHVCVKSAVQHLRPSHVYFWCEHVPRGPWWDLTAPIVDVVRVEAPRAIFGRPLLHVAHRADVVRLEKLIDYGGIYLDADVFVRRNFDDLLSHQVVLGKQAFPDGELGLCNAVILAERGAPFLLRWRDAYKSFRSTGRDEFWDEHSVRVPGNLAAQAPQEITVLPQEAFFWPSWTDIGLERIFHSTEPITSPQLYANHLWEAQAWARLAGDN